MRNILDDLDAANNHEIIENLVSGFYRLSTPVDKDNLDIEKAKRLLQEFRDSVGSDPIDRAVQERERIKKQQEARLRSESTQLQMKKIEDLNTKFVSLIGGTEFTPQKRGFELETLFFDLLHIEEFEFRKPYRLAGEQIDGHFNYEKFDYLVEIKWVKDTIKQGDLSIFDGKILGKAQSTRGFFLSANGFDDNAVNKYTGDSPRIILMDGQELTNILEGRKTFFDCVRFKVDALVRFGDIFRKE